jgi:acyl carrier protein
VEDTVTLSATEQALAQIWSEVLQSSSLPNADDDFFELGGDSMTMVLVESRIKEEFSVELPPGAMLGASTLRAVSSLVEARRTHSGN